MKKQRFTCGACDKPLDIRAHAFCDRCRTPLCDACICSCKATADKATADDVPDFRDTQPITQPIFCPCSTCGKTDKVSIHWSDHTFWNVLCDRCKKYSKCTDSSSVIALASVWYECNQIGTSGSERGDRNRPMENSYDADSHTPAQNFTDDSRQTTDNQSTGRFEDWKSRVDASRQPASSDDVDFRDTIADLSARLENLEVTTYANEQSKFDRLAVIGKLAIAAGVAKRTLSDTVIPECNTATSHWCRLMNIHAEGLIDGCRPCRLHRDLHSAVRQTTDALTQAIKALP